MKKILFLFALTMLFALGASAQSFPTTVQVDPDSTNNHVEAIDVYDTTIGTTTVYEFDYDSIVSIDSVFGPHGFMGMDTTYLCTDTIEITDTVIIPVPNFHNYLAVADSGWLFDHWMIVLPYENDSTIVLDTVFSHTAFFGDDLDDEFWCDWPAIPDSTDEYLGHSIELIAYFTEDTNNVGIREVHDGATFTVYPNPTSGTVAILGEIHWIQVYDLSGRIVTETNKPVIDLRGQPNGTYIFRVTNTNGQVGVTKVIKR